MQAEGAPAAGVERGVDLGGDWSSGALRNEAAVAVGWRAWLLRHLRGAMSTWVCSVGSCGGCGHGGEKLGRRRGLVSGKTVKTACKRDGEDGGSGEELTVMKIRSASSGEAGAEQGGEEDLRRPEVEEDGMDGVREHPTGW